MDPNIPETDDRDPIGSDLTALEHRLAAWQPSAGALDRDRMLYDAGRAAVAVDRWRLATAALLLLSMGLAGALISQRSSLARERALLAQERSQRQRLETRLAARIEASSSPAEPPAIESPAPSSYLALTARLDDGLDLGAGRGPDSGPAPPRPAPDPAGGPLHPAPLRPQEIRRILDL